MEAGAVVAVGTSTHGADPSPDACHLTDAALQSEVTSTTLLQAAAAATPAMPPTHPRTRPTATLADSAPSLASYSYSSAESDTETETDAYTDTDAESDAPTASTLPSPPCDFEGDGTLADLDLDIKLDADPASSPGQYPRIHSDPEPGSYFPPVAVHALPEHTPIPPHTRLADAIQPESQQQAHATTTTATLAGQTPPLSVLYPSPKALSDPLPEIEVQVEAPPAPALALPRPDATPLVTALHPGLRRKLMLEALPSPALVPPSPFELEPSPRAGGGLDAAALALSLACEEELDAGDSGEDEGEGEGSEREGEERGARPDATPTPPEDSPLPTLEAMRAAWDARERTTIAVGVAGLLAPSISRRRPSS